MHFYLSRFRNIWLASAENVVYNKCHKLFGILRSVVHFSYCPINVIDDEILEYSRNNVTCGHNRKTKYQCVLEPLCCLFTQVSTKRLKKSNINDIKLNCIYRSQFIKNITHNGKQYNCRISS